VIQHAVSKATQRAYAGSDKHMYIIDAFSPDRPPAKMSDVSGTRSLHVEPQSYGDQLNVSQLLWVAGIDLDEIVPDPTNRSSNTSVRYDGQTVTVRVVYSGDRMQWNPNATYEYVVAANDLEAKLTYTDSSGAYMNGTAMQREVVDLHGLQVLFSQHGSLRVFDFPTLMLSLVSGIAFLSMAKVTADFFLLYLAPRRNDYKLFVASASPDFSPDSEAEQHVLEQILKKKRQKHALLFGLPDSSASNAPPQQPQASPPAIYGSSLADGEPCHPSSERGSRPLNEPLISPQSLMRSPNEERWLPVGQPQSAQVR